MERASKDLGDVEVKDASGRTRRLREAWTGRIGVVLFVRQFG